MKLARPVRLFFVYIFVLLPLLSAGPVPQLAAQAPTYMAQGWTMLKFPTPQPGCSGVGVANYLYFDRLDCGFGYVGVTNTTDKSSVYVRFLGPDGAQIGSPVKTTYRSAQNANAWQFLITPGASWPAGRITIQVYVEGQPPAGETSFYLNQLGATVGPQAKPEGAAYAPGEAVTIIGDLFELDSVGPLSTNKTNVSGEFYLRVVKPNGETSPLYGPFTANQGGIGKISASVPGSATAGLTASAETNYQVTVGMEVVNAASSNLATGAWAAKRAGAAYVTYTIPPGTLVIENNFVSSVGWVKPGESYPFRILVKNYTPNAAENASVTLPVVDGTTFVKAEPVAGAGTAQVNADGSITWSVGSLPAATTAGPSIKTLVVEARADTLGQDPQIVWKDLSSTAQLSYTGGPSGLSSTSHGPKVIPPKSTYETARYGDRPFPVVPVDYYDRKHKPAHTGAQLSAVINSPQVEGSTFNLYQEMSYGQLFPKGTVPSAGFESKDWNVTWNSSRYQTSGFQFTAPQPQGTCKGTTQKENRGTAIYAERIRNGWYQLPGDTEYYGGDRTGTAIAGVSAGVSLLAGIDDACGPIGKAVYDAAHIADPEIDYSDYDTDKDGVVDFFMMVFVGQGGNGVSQTSVPPYDNIWPHSTSLEFYYTDPATGLKGYISDDQLKDLQGRPLYYTNANRVSMTTSVTEFPVYVRVGPYNVNPESAVEKASVISHEYGHSLGLPDFYSTGGRSTYGDWNLMATDKSQHMDVYSKQKLGWLVPRTVQPGVTTVMGWQDSKLNTRRIDWVQPDGTPYALQGPRVNNGEAYMAKLPPRKIIDASEVPSGDHLWWSRSGNMFGCPPFEGHNLDIFLPELESLPADAGIKLSFKSKWDIEWDYDYGFVMISTDGGKTYTSLASEKGYSTPTFNPNNSDCQGQYGNGLTGTSGSYAAGTQELDRVEGAYPTGGFLDDEYNLSAAAGKSTVLRFSYATDPGLARPGWFIDDLKIETSTGQVIYSTDFETSGNLEDERIYNGGCKTHTRVAENCTNGWLYVSAESGSPADHAYFMELRDRSGFDFDGHDQNDRAPIGFLPGLLLVYADETHGRGNVGTPDPPAQTPLDSQPQPGNRSPNLHDAAFTSAAGDSIFSDLDVDGGHTDNYTDPRVRAATVATPAANWVLNFNCLKFEVLSMSGTDIGPATAPGNLQGDVRFTLGPGCSTPDYGSTPDVNNAPTAVAQARPASTPARKPITFDGSASFDDQQTAAQLTYAWDFQSDGTYDASGQVVEQSFQQPGTYSVTLRVTDANGASDTDSVTVQVGPCERCQHWVPFVYR